MEDHHKWLLLSDLEKQCLRPTAATPLDNPSFNSTEIAMKITIKVNVNEKVHPLLKQSTATEAAVTI